ncbi:MAG: hypothetical protein KAG61_11930 [Bacteriovoracaceae bacterium]|nr:hypothetical protein [Bacteriovoracaceae bacterium]
MKSFILVVTLLWSSFALSNGCEEIRASFDIGSATTKMLVAKVNTCLNKKGKILLEKSVPIPFKVAIDNSQNGEFDSEIQSLGISELSKLKEEASSFTPNRYVAVATSAFRKATNGKIYAKRIERILGITFKIIDQKTEAILGHLGAIQAVSDNSKDLLVWDIGGGSMQMTYLTKDQNYKVYEGKLASVSFKNMVTSGIKGKSYKTNPTPNPLGKHAARKALNLAEYYAKIHVPNDVKDAIKRSKVIGIGSLHYYSILKNVAPEEKHYQLSQVLKHYNTQKLLSDSQIGGEYASTDVTNLALVSGFMKELGIENVYVYKINMAHGILTYQDYWK